MPHFFSACVQTKKEKIVKKLHRYKKKIILSIFLLFFLCAEVIFSTPALAGFGITPPYVKNDSLVRNSVYEQKIILVRSDPVEDLKAEITVNVPQANDWFSVDRGMEFIMPKGEKQVPIIVKTAIPENAEFKNYKGYIRIRIVPVGPPQAGAVSIALGAQVDVDIKVIDKEIFDFRVISVEMRDLIEGHKLAWLFFPGKIRFKVKMENTGNVPSAPTKVEMDIFNPQGKMVEQTKSTNKIKKIDAFKSGDAVAELPTRLPAGGYTAKYRIFKFEDVVQEGEVGVSILPLGTYLEGYVGYGFMGLSLRDKLSIIGIGAAIIICVAMIFWILRRRSKRKKAR